MIAGLYGMVDPERGEPAGQVALLADEGVSIVQLRCKGWPRDRVRALALAVMPLPIRLVINDDAALAAELGLLAHLGDGDGAALGPHGRSTHTLEQVRDEAEAEYIGFGPVFATGTKETSWSPRGTALLAAAVRTSTRPVVAIGGIGLHNIDEVRATGVQGWAVVGAIWGAANPRSVVRQLR